LDHPNRPTRKKIRTCTLPGCNKQIRRRGNGRKFCSVDCSVKARKKLKSILCPTCDNQFSPKRFRQIYCSAKCRKENKEFCLKTTTFGNVRRFVKVNKKWKLAALVTWETHHGDVPQGKSIWFKDNESFNDLEISNLYLIEHKEFIALSKKNSHNQLEEDENTSTYSQRIVEPDQNNKEKFFDHKQEFF